eukprot:11042452-Alexandrium_andersonii.AAC.1
MDPRQLPPQACSATPKTASATPSGAPSILDTHFEEGSAEQFVTLPVEKPTAQQRALLAKCFKSA